MKFIVDYFKINQKLVRNPYPLPVMVDNIRHLGVFHYVDTLDIDMGYSTRSCF